ncbi:MAG: hypothetical protein RXO22_04755 [Thermocladium sp.]|jgi:hypothetical protein|nr:MAG: hypothetical protein AT710_03190 [Thermocladium sp. ECH_B]
MRVAYSLIALAGIIIASSIIIAFLFPVELMFSVEPRYWYVIYIGGSIIQTQTTPLYIIMWRTASLLFLSWLSLIIIYIIKPLSTADALSIIIGAAFIVFNYLYLFTIGAPLSFYPLIFVIHTIGHPLTYIDMGQVMIIYIIWRILALRKRGLLKIFWAL